MTRDDIVKLAWDCGILMRSHQHQDEPTKLERFAERIAAHEREACADILLKYAGRDDLSDSDESLLKHLFDLIRARGET